MISFWVVSALLKLLKHPVDEKTTRLLYAGPILHYFLSEKRCFAKSQLTTDQYALM